jgi:hypothetical protein
MSRYDNDVRQPVRLRTEIARLQSVRDTIATGHGAVGARQRREELTDRIAYLDAVLADATR